MSEFELSLEADEEVLYLTPYTPEETFDFSYGYENTAQIRYSFFEAAQKKDPEFFGFRQALKDVQERFQLKGGLVNDDLALLTGPVEQLQQVHEALSNRYDGDIVTGADFFRMLEIFEEQVRQEHTALEHISPERLN